MNARIKDTDRGYQAMVERIHEAAKAKLRVTIGVHEAEGSQSEDEDDGTTVLDVAIWNEFGTSKMPARSFIADWSDENVDRHRKQLRMLSNAVLKGQLASVEVALDRFGLLAVSEVQNRIKEGIAPELAASTIAQKGSSTPLINSGHLWSSIKHKVTAGGAE